jgi:hypothetical protein
MNKFFVTLFIIFCTVVIDISVSTRAFKYLSAPNTEYNVNGLLLLAFCMCSTFCSCWYCINYLKGKENE